jgi:hypothetical protein
MLIGVKNYLAKNMIGIIGHKFDPLHSWFFRSFLYISNKYSHPIIYIFLSLKDRVTITALQGKTAGRPIGGFDDMENRQINHCIEKIV